MDVVYFLMYVASELSKGEDKLGDPNEMPIKFVGFLIHSALPMQKLSA